MLFPAAKSQSLMVQSWEPVTIWRKLIILLIQKQTTFNIFVRRRDKKNTNFRMYALLVNSRTRAPFYKEKFLSPDQEEEHVSCPTSLRISVNLKKLKCECPCAEVQCTHSCSWLAKQWKNSRVDHKKPVVRQAKAKTWNTLKSYFY